MAVVEFHGVVMASRLHMIVNGPRDDRQPTHASALLERLESLWSRFIPTSDISRINSGAGTAVPVSGETIDLVERMLEAWKETQGLYDATVLPVLVADGYAASKVDPTRLTVLPAGPFRVGAMAEVEVDRFSSTVTIPLGVAIDPGGIGKGLAADTAVAVLLDGGADGALVGIGGDLAAGGEPPDRHGWPIDVEHAEPTDVPLCQVMIDGGGVATSSTVSRRWSHQNRERHHVIDPLTGTQATTDLAAVTVFTSCGWLAEAYATAAILGTSTSVVDFLDSHALTGIAIATDGRVLSTSDLDELQLSIPVGLP